MRLAAIDDFDRDVWVVFFDARLQGPCVGFGDVRTYLQSGNIVLSTRRNPESTATACEELIAAELGLEIPAVVRTRDELAEVVRRNPLAGVADDPKRYQISFLDGEPDPRARSAARSTPGTPTASPARRCGRPWPARASA